MRNTIILENIRSAYNVGNIIRTADALGRDVRITGYTPHPEEQTKVIKTSLGAEKTVGLKRFDNSQEAIIYAKDKGFNILAGELNNQALSLDEYKKPLDKTATAIILGNEIDGVINSTLKLVDAIVYIPMQGIKESLNVGQSAAIFMWELGK